MSTSSVRLRVKLLHRWMRSLLVLLLALVGTSARAQVLDRIEIVPSVAGETEIVLRMSTGVLYQRHAPPGAGTELRIFLRLMSMDPSSGARETLYSPPSPLVPRFRLSFPENDGSLLVVFESRTAYRVNQGRDSRSISIFVPTRGELPPARNAPAGAGTGGADPK